MISFEKIDNQNYLEHREELVGLYLKVFTSGFSAQHISDSEARKFIDNLFVNGYGICGFEEDKLVAALLSTPPSFDQLSPKPFKDKYNDYNAEYVAEVLVDERHRGKGIGKKLMQIFESQIKKETKHILLRVWDKNKAAVGLYTQSGYLPCGNITQTKLKPISKEPFEMNKIYMTKST